MSHPTLYLMLGYPGSGKTTAAKVIADITGANHIWADHERRLKFENPTYGHQEHMRLYDELNHKTRALLSEGKSVVYDTDFRYKKDRDLLRKIAKETKSTAILVWVKTPITIAKQRATQDAHLQSNRVLGNMPEDKFEHLTDSQEEPQKNEEYIELDGTKITKGYVADKLNIVNT